MEPNAVETRIAQMVEPILDSLGLCLWGVDAQMGGKGQTVLVYVEAAEGTDSAKGADSASAAKPAKGVDIDQLAKASRHLSLLLDVEDDFIRGAYRLEVSSPGMERPFFKLDQLHPYVGRKVQAKSHTALDGRKKFRGELAHVGNTTIRLETEQGMVELDWSDVRRIKLLVEDPWAEAKARQAAKKTAKKKN